MMNYVNSYKNEKFYRPRVLTRPKNVDENEFYRACFNGDFESAATILKLGVNLNKRFEHGRTLIHIACMKNFYGLVKLLLKFGCNEFIKDNLSRTSLHYAAMKGGNAIVRYLVERNTFSNDSTSIQLTKEFIDAKDTYGKSALHYACQQNQIQSVLFILSSNCANVNVEDNDGVTPLMIAYENTNWELFELLIKYEASVPSSMLREICSKANEKLVNILIRCDHTRKYKINWNEMDENGNSAIYFAFRYSFNTDFINSLLKNEVRLNEHDISDFLNDVRTFNNTSMVSNYIEYLILLLKYSSFSKHNTHSNDLHVLLDLIYNEHLRSDTTTQTKCNYRILFMFALAIYSKQLDLTLPLIRKWMEKLCKTNRQLKELFIESTRQPWSLQMIARNVILAKHKYIQNNLRTLSSHIYIPNICMKYLQFEYI